MYCILLSYTNLLTLLPDGSGVFVTSSTKNTNIDLLRDYIFTILYPNSTNQESTTIEKQVSENGATTEKKTETERNMHDYETATVLIGEDSISKMEQLDLNLLFENMQEAHSHDIRELIPEETGALMELEGYIPETNKDLGEYVTVLDYQTFLARQVKSQTLYKSRSTVSMFKTEHHHLESPTRPLMRSSSTVTVDTGSSIFNTPAISATKNTSISDKSDGDHSSSMITETPLSFGSASDEAGLEEAEDFFKNVLKKMKK
jgi:hypothetical protein